MKQVFSTQKQTKSGFSLIEMLVAIAIFSIISFGVTQIFGRGIASYHEVKKAQVNLETAQFALNLIAKELRTSTVVNSVTGVTVSTIKFYDYSQAKCIEYILDESAGQITRRDGVIVLGSPNPTDNDFRNACLSYVFPGVAQVVFSGLLDQAMNVVQSTPVSPDPPGPSVGRVTIAITVGSGSNRSTLQTSISLRDYSYTGL